MHSMTLIEPTRHAETYQRKINEVQFVSFERLEQSDEKKAKKIIATVTVWKLKQKQLSPHRIYQLNDPIITSKIHYGSALDKIIHKTSDGDAFVFYNDYSRGSQRKRIGILDQSWPDSERLPFLQEQSDKLNEFRLPNGSRRLIEGIIRELSDPSHDFIGKYYRSVQFFNNFSFFAHSTLGLTSKIVWLNQESTIRETNLMDPWCELILGFDETGDHVYYLGNDKKPNYNGKHLSKSYKALQNMIKNLKKDGKMIIVKFNLRQEREVKRCTLCGPHDEDGLEPIEGDPEAIDPAINMLREAFEMKADIVPHLDLAKKIIIFELVPTNAAVSFDLAELIDDDEKG